MQEHTPHENPTPVVSPKKSASKMPLLLGGGITLIALGLGVYLLRPAPEQPAPVVEAPPLFDVQVPSTQMQQNEVRPSTPPNVEKPLEVQAPKKSKRAIAKERPKQRPKQLHKQLPKQQPIEAREPQGEEAEIMDETTFTIDEAKDWDLPDKPQIDVNSQEMKIAPQTGN